MNRAVSLLKGLLFFCCALLLLLCWWSSTVLETQVRSLYSQIEEIKKQKSVLTDHSFTSGVDEISKKPLKALELADSHFPNILKIDPFYESVLPELIGRHFQPRGIRKEAFLGRPENLHPFNAFRDVSQLINMCTGSVSNFCFGKFESMTPELALKMEVRPRVDKPHLNEYWIHLRDDLFWEPIDSSFFPVGYELAEWFKCRHHVTAHDFKFFYDAIMNPYVSEPKAVSLRTYYSEIEEFEIKNPLTFVIRWKPSKDNEAQIEKTKYSSLDLTCSLQPLASFVYKYFSDGDKIVEDDSEPDTYRLNSIWAQNFSQHWAKNIIPSCGPYVFSGMNEEGILLKKNVHYFQKLVPLVEGVHYRFKESTDAIWQDFKAGSLDLCLLSPNQELELQQFLNSPQYLIQKGAGQEIHSIEYVDRCFYYIGWNCLSPLFQNKTLRKAMTLAIDRKRIIEQNLADKAIGITGPFFCFSPSYDKSISEIPFDPDLAAHLLDEEGWIDLDGDGIREKTIKGQTIQFRFQLCYFVKSLASKIIAQYIATSLQNIGIQCEPYGLDITDLARRFDDKEFDALFMGWKLGAPPDDPRQIWHSEGASQKGSSNAIGFMNSEIDTIIERLNFEEDSKSRLRLYHRFHKIIHEQCPYTFLYTPKARLVYRSRLKNLFIPSERQDLVPGANIPEPSFHITWLAE